MQRATPDFDIANVSGFRLKRATWKHGGAVLLATVLAPAAVHAQAGLETRAAVLRSATAAPTVELREIMVTATRQKLAESKVPVTVTVFDAKQLEERGITSKLALQSAVAGLTVMATGSQNQLNYSIRGQSVDAFSGSTPGVLEYYNDVEVPSLASAAFYDLSSVQVLEGPQGTLFGRNDIGGAVLFGTRQPSNKWGGYLTVRNGNYGLTEYQGAINVPILARRAALRIAADVTNENGYVKNIANNTTLGNTDAKSIRATLRLTPTASLTSDTVFQYGYYGGTELMGGLYSYYKIGQTNNGYALDDLAALLYTPGGPFWSSALAAQVPGGIAEELTTEQRDPYNESLPYTPRNISQQYYVENTSAYRIGAELTLKNIVSYQHYRIRQDAPLSGAPLGVLTIAAYPGTSGFRYLINQWSEELQAIGSTAGGKLKYIGGLYASVKDDNTDIPVLVGSSLPAPLEFFHHQWSSTDRSQAVYLQGTYDLSSFVRGLSVTLGGRETWDQHTLTQGPLSNFAGYPRQTFHEKAPSWQAGLQEQLTPALLLYVTQSGSWSHGGINGTTSPVGNLNEFKPEYTHAWEVGAKFAGRLLDRPLHLNVSAYDQITADVQRDIYFSINGAPSSFTTNVPQSEVKGVDLHGEMLLTKWLTLGGAGSFGDGSYPEGKVSVFGQSITFSNYQALSRWSGSAFAEVRLPTPSNWGEMSFRADGYYQTSQALSSLLYSIAPGTLLPSYALVNLRYSWGDVMGSNASVAVYVKNMLNREYYVGGFPLGPDVGYNTAIPGAPRQFGVQLHYHF